ncbi:MAG: toprim domain-containing protein [Candidimonas sp.]|nr:MAG: toprim domain-containing protein [Candidimonas sp.]
MARVQEAELARLKSDVSLVRLIEAGGIELKRQGKDYACRCPFHEDAVPSLIVTPGKNLFHCFGCGAAGGPIDWVMKFEKVSFRHAVEKLRTELGAAPPAPVLPSAALPVIPADEVVPDLPGVERQALLRRVLAYYHDTLKQSPEAQEYLKARGLSHSELIVHFQLGYANRTLGYNLPAKQIKSGAEIRGQLQRVGLMRESGHEHFNGSLVVPVIGLDGQVHEVYGRKIRDNLRQGTAYHLYLPGAHAGVWNEAGLAASDGEVILCEALIDAMTFWVHGLRNVTASYGVNGFTPDHLTVFQRHGIQRVLIAYDRDKAGDDAAMVLAERLMAVGIDCFRIVFPKGMDANEYALKMQPAAKALALLVRKAQWLGNGRAPELHTVAMDGAVIGSASEPSSLAALPVQAPAAVAELALAAKNEAGSLVELPEPGIVSPLPPAPAVDGLVTRTDSELVLQYGERRYRVRGWNKPLNPEALKVNLLVSRAAPEHSPADAPLRPLGEGFHVDSLDLYQAKARAAYVKQAGLELGEAEDVLKHDLGRILLHLETLQAERLHAALAQREQIPAMDPLQRADALALLKDPKLMERILADFDALGVVGEETNKLVGYLAAVSRQLDKPLAVLIQSSSAAGKSSLMDAVLALVPDEAQVRYSAMTGQSVFYLGETNLKHKILAIAEEEGAAQASYALKLLQSDGQVTMASTGKDANTGLLITREYKVEGPVMLFLTTTAIDIDEELLNRCVVLTVNESREQTRAIHALQRKRQTLEGMLADEGREAVQTLHHNAQRLLQPLKVVNPYADQLRFADDKTRTRRDHMKYLSLIKSIALLHQYQREVKTVEHRGKQVHYIEVEPGDIAIANRLAAEVLGRTLDELPPQTRKLLTLLHGWVRSECARQSLLRSDFHFTRRQVRELTGWGDTQLRVHLGRLAELEYLIEQGGRRGQVCQYELAYGGEGERGQPFLMGLIDAATLTTASSRGDKGDVAGGSRPQSGPIAAATRGGEIVRNASSDATCNDTDRDNPENAYLHVPRGGSYRTQPSAFLVAAQAAGKE